MKAIMVMFDSLNRRMLPAYGCDWVKMPNFSRLAERTVTFDNSYVGSMPCMPARREIHTGRYNFLHRSWGPLEPFDDSMPEILKKNGIHSHLASDHYHYWEDGGSNYHNRYQTWQMARGQEGDPWKAVLGPVDIPKDNLNDTYGKGLWGRQDWVNRSFMKNEVDMPQAVTFSMGEEFLRTNHTQDNWFLTIETFDPHEPYFSAQRFKDLYPHDYDDPVFDWPPYANITETPEQVQHMRYESAALHSQCDHYLGKVLDLMDELDLWDDTMLIVNTDHGFLLSEHDWWGKCSMPFYNEIAHTPLFMWDPRCGKQGKRRNALVQTIDMAPTLLDYFSVAIPPDMQGFTLADTMAHDTPVREAALFGMFGAHVNVTDGRYVYMRAPSNPANTPLYEYTLMPAHMREPFGVDELTDIKLSAPFNFTKSCQTMQIPARPWLNAHQFGSMLFDTQSDPNQQHPIHDPEIESGMLEHMIKLMQENDAPAEQYERLGVGGMDN